MGCEKGEEILQVIQGREVVGENVVNETSFSS